MSELENLLSTAEPATPAECDRLVVDLADRYGADALRSALVVSLAGGRNLDVVHRMLLRIADETSDAALVPLLASPDVAVARQAAAVLANRVQGPRPAALGSALRRAVLAHEDPPRTAREALGILRWAELLEVVEGLDDEPARRVQQVLFFLPRVPYSEAQWPAAWARAARMLNRAGRTDLLYEVAESEGPHYLGALGAVALAKLGFLTEGVRDWLRSTRDYHLLDDAEQDQLRQALGALGNADAELAYLDSLNG